jgi:DNA-binding FadR family transcriptional regulator
MVSGEVIREIGSGTYLTDAAPSAVHESQYHTLGMFDVSALRAMLEPNIVALAAVTADKTDIDEILRCLQGQEYATNYEEFEKWDVALHRSFVKATHNRLLLEVYAVIEKARDDPSWKSYKSRTFTSNLEMYQAQHKEIVSFLVDRDAVAAGSAMRRHISAVSQALVSETPQSAQNLVLPVLNNLQIVE